MSNDTLKSISEWFKTATPAPTNKNILVQLGCHFEEVTEMIEVLTGEPLPEIVMIADELKQGGTNEQVAGFIQSIDRTALLDALCDQIVTAIGVAEYMGMDIHGALDEVNRSNWSKFENGKPIRNEHGKIIKGADYEAPKLEQFV
ncbi:phosphoribosyl-ATP pyrophosphohydrolase [Moraxella nasovis]|uniref:nucleoside triphosphate pyrophosphohydrolase family protein n=1 Tax=Moraxella nasovis TaxID=2904121 RepID=UPI001F60B240|nr:nucleoside triphosphate pyrophosphohydrolase family protein [Moraxella nasovis]UNU74147.1 phosphoribosyl-ATP pyrophosphohydrolase [Moraxella nasovis]